jgi:hypothetical protein
MSGFELVALSVATIWLGLLTLLSLIVVRHVGLLTLRIQAGHVSEGDGLLVGDRVPAEAVALVPELDEELRYLVFLSESCGACREIAPMLDDVPDTGQLLTLVMGDGGRQTIELADAVPLGVNRLHGDAAQRVGDAFRLRQTPQAIQVENGIVIGKATLHSMNDLHNLIKAYAFSDAHEIGVTMREVHDHAGA